MGKSSEIGIDTYQEIVYFVFQVYRKKILVKSSENTCQYCLYT